MVEQLTNQLRDGGSNPTSPLQYTVRGIPKEQTHTWLLKKHYAHSIPGLSYTFGLWDDSNILQGVCCYGSPANNHNNNMGEFTQIELVRLVINDGVVKNTLSSFVSRTFRFLPKPLSLISYADSGKNHCGYIYQATNWIYTGLSNNVDSYIDENNNEIHSRIMSDYRLRYPEKSRAEIAEMLHCGIVKGTFKHRYFKFIGDKREYKRWLSYLLEKYKILDYPKGDNKRYDASYTPQVQGVLI